MKIMLAWGAPPLYRMLQRFFLLLFRLLTHIDLSGQENVPRQGPLVIAPNHIFIIDVAVIFIAIPRRLTVFAGEKWRGTPGGWLMDAVANAIYVNRGEVDRRALGQALEVLRAGGALGLAPEGTRSRTGGLQAGKDGLVYLASRSNAGIVPMVAWGQEQLWVSWRHFRRPVIHVRIGEPIYLPPEASRARSAQLGEYTERVMLAMARMLPAQYRGVYAGKVQDPI